MGVMEISLLQNCWDPCPVSTTLEQVVEMIHSNRLVEQLTEKHRAHPETGHKDASPMFVVPGIVEGGKRQKDIVRMTGLEMVDFEHLSAPTPDTSP